MNEQLVNSMLNLIKDGKNPEQLMISYLQNMNTPIGNNLAAMAQAGNQSGLEQFARNLCAQRGMDFDKEFNNFKSKMKF